MTKEERETIIRYSDDDEPAYLSTFSDRQAKKWAKAGIELSQRGLEWMGRVDKKRIGVRKPRNNQGNLDKLKANMARARLGRQVKKA